MEEKEQDEADLGDQFDAGLVGDHMEPDVRTEDRTRQDVAENQRLVQAAGEKREDGGDDDAEADRGQQVHEAPSV